MLNQNLKLNPKLFDQDVEIKPTRAGYGEGLLQLGETNPNVVALSADLTESTYAHLFAEKFPDRFFEVGVAEQNMAAIAAGLGVSGKIAFISSYATFSPGKNWETIRTTIVYNQSNVKIAGHHAGIMTGPDGATHQATEDIAITRCWPDIEIYVPCDAIEAKKATVASAATTKPVYLRYTRDKTPIITTEDTPFSVGKMQDFWTNPNPVTTIFATGYMLFYAMQAAKELEEEGIQTLVVNASTIKPLDEDGIMRFTGHTKAVVTVEDHQVMGGLGSAIAEFLARTNPMPMEFIGLQNTFAESGTPKELVEKYGMGVGSIKEAVKKVIKRKSEE
jgi:transketolase